MNAEQFVYRNKLIQGKLFSYEESLKEFLRMNYSEEIELFIEYEISSGLHKVLHIFRQLDEYKIWDLMNKQTFTCEEYLTFYIFQNLSEIFMSYAEDMIKMTRLYFSLHTETRESYSVIKDFIDLFDMLSMFMDDVYNALRPVFESNSYEITQEKFYEPDTSQTIFTYNVSGNKKITFKCGDLASSGEEYDIVVCSAGKNSYIPSKGTLIEAFARKKRIVLHNLAKKPELDLKNMNCWLSKEIPESNFHRIACVELMSYKNLFLNEQMNEKMICSTFITFRYMLEQASNWGISVKRVALPLLGTGRMRIDCQFIAAPLFKQCLNALETIYELEEIVFYEVNEDKLNMFVNTIKHMTKEGQTESPCVFISYSSKQIEMAHSICNALTKRNIGCWIAPECIPAGSDYLEEIPLAIKSTRILLLILTTDAMESKWVKKEVSSAIGAGNMVIPYQIADFELDTRFKFIMDGIQIIPAWKYSNDSEYRQLVEEVNSCMNEINVS